MSNECPNEEIPGPVQVTAKARGRGRGEFHFEDEGFIADPTRIIRPVCEPYKFAGKFVSSTLGPTVSKKALALNVIRVDDKTREESIQESQVGLLKVVNTDGSDVVLPVTASSNILGNCSIKLVVPQRRVFRGVAPGPKGPTNATLEDMNDAIRKAWHNIAKKVIPLSSFDNITTSGNVKDSIVYGKAVTAPALLEKMRHFERVPGTYQCQAGQLIGISVYSEEGATPESAGVPSVSQGEVDKVFGSPREVYIYSGSILKVVNNCIVHDINTYRNCAGAIVFLLDEGQPESVGEDCFGKAIAVHSEVLSDTSSDGNIAILL